MPSFATATGLIAYEILDAQEPPQDGAAPSTLTLLHNFMSTGRAAWGALLPVLNQRYRVLLPDLPGHGKSVGRPPGFDHQTIAAQLARLMQEAGADAGHLAGCSSGGMIAQLMVHHGMVRPQTLTLVSTTYSTDRARTGATTSLTPENFQAGRKWLDATARMHDPYQGQGYFDEVLLPGFRALTPTAAIDLTLEDLGKFALPVCLIQGERDEFFPPLVARSMAQALPDAELHLVPGQTHALLFRQPRTVADLMMSFFEAHGAAPPAIQAAENAESAS